jgi:predicted outer membrane protein
MLISAGVAAQSASTGTDATGDGPAPPSTDLGPAASSTDLGAGTTVVLPAPRPVVVEQSPFNERGGGDQTALMALHQRNQEAITDAQLAQQRAESPAAKELADSVVHNRSVLDAQIMSYASQQGMNVGVIRLGAGGLPHGTLTRVDLLNTTGARFDYDFATKIVADQQATVDQTQQAVTLARAPGMTALLQGMLPAIMAEQSQAMAVVAALPRPRPRELDLPGIPNGVSRTHTGVDTRPGVAP